MHLGRFGREDALNAVEHVRAVGVLADDLLLQPAHGLLAERVVGHHRLLGDAEQRQQDGRQQAGPVLARRAVEDRRQGVGTGQHLEGRTDLGPGVVQHLEVLRLEQVGPAVELLGIGDRLDEGDVVVLHRMSHHVELSALQLVGGPQVDDGTDAQIAQHGEVALGQLAQAVGPEERAPAGHRVARGDARSRRGRGSSPRHRARSGVRRCQSRVTNQETGMSHIGNQRFRSCSTGRSTPTMLRMRNSSSVSRRSFETSTGAKG